MSDSINDELSNHITAERHLSDGPYDVSHFVLGIVVPGVLVGLVSLFIGTIRVMLLNRALDNLLSADEIGLFLGGTFRYALMNAFQFGIVTFIALVIILPIANFRSSRIKPFTSISLGIVCVLAVILNQTWISPYINYGPFKFYAGFMIAVCTPFVCVSFYQILVKWRKK